MIDPNTPGVPVTPVSPNVTPEPSGYLATEPVKAATRVTQLVATIAAFFLLVGVDLTAEQLTALATLGPGLLVGLEFLGNWLRANVTPVNRAQALIDRAYVASPEAGETNKPKLPS